MNFCLKPDLGSDHNSAVMESALVSTDLRSVGDVFGAVADETDCLHAGVGERSVAGELRQTFDSVLEGINGSWEMLLEYIRCEERRDNRCLLQTFQIKCLKYILQLIYKSNRWRSTSENVSI